MRHKDILEMCLKKMDSGTKKYGIFNYATDTRCLYSEMQEELVDLINYAVMQIEKIENLKVKSYVKKPRPFIEGDKKTTTRITIKPMPVGGYPPPAPPKFPRPNF